MTSVRFSSEEESLIEQYLMVTGLTKSEAIRKAVLDAVEDEIEVRIAKKAYESYLKDPETITFAQLKKELGFE